MPEPIGGVQPFAELARGGATVVYKGYRRTDNRLVLLKTVRPEGGENEDLVGRFEEEARLAAQVCHPNVVSVFDSGRDGATAYLVTEFVEGLDLGALIGQGPLPPALAAYVLHEAAEGLAAVHAQGILHRDLKPANILISAEGTVKLADFGLASLAPSGASERDAADLEVRGTLGYLAPEIVRGDPPSPRADLFSLGAVLVEMVTGRPAFARDATGATLDAVLHHDPASTLAADPRVPLALADLASDLLRKDPQQRPSSAEAIAGALAPVRARYPVDGDDLAAYLHDPESYVPPPVPPSVSTPAPVAAEAPAPSRRRMGWGIAVSVLVLVVIGVVGASLVSERQGPPMEVALRDPVAGPAGDPADVASAVPLDTASNVPDEVVLSPPEAESVPPEVEAGPPATEAESAATDAGGGEGALESVADSEPVSTAAEPEGPDPVPDPLDVGPEIEPEATPGTLVVAAEPWARVRIDGEEVGTTPLAALTLPPGRHTVTFENPDFPPHAVEVDVESGGEERLAVSLWDLVGRVTLVVSPWAEVAVDGAYWDTVPPQERPLVLTPGAHRLAFTHPTFGTREATLRIAAGESRTLRINLSEEGS